MLKILDKIVYIVSLIAAFGLIGAYLSPIINPNTFVFFRYWVWLILIF